MVLSTLSQDEAERNTVFADFASHQKDLCKGEILSGSVEWNWFWLVSAVVVGIVTAVRNRGTAPVDFIWECLLYLTVYLRCWH